MLEEWGTRILNVNVAAVDPATLIASMFISIKRKETCKAKRHDEGEHEA